MFISPGERLKKEANSNTVSQNEIPFLFYPIRLLYILCLPGKVHPLNPQAQILPLSSSPFGSAPPQPVPLFGITKTQNIEEEEISLREWRRWKDREEGGAVGLAVGKLFLTKRRKKASGHIPIHNGRHRHIFWPTIFLLHICIHELSPEFSRKQEIPPCVPGEFYYTVNQIV